MGFESLLLGVAERVLSTYIVNFAERKHKAKSKAELLAMVREEVRSSDLADDVRTLKQAFAELEAVVGADPSLNWDGDQLVLGQPRRIGPVRDADPVQAIADLEATVEKRRRELGLTVVAETTSQPSGEVSTEAPTPNDVLLTPVPAAETAESSLAPWAQRVLDLPSEASRLRRKG
jgi:hypothetical protein